jgi:hypothetical protein
LDGITELPDPSALKLSEHDGEIWLSGMKTISKIGHLALLEHGNVKTAIAIRNQETENSNLESDEENPAANIKAPPFASPAAYQASTIRAERIRHGKQY